LGFHEKGLLFSLFPRLSSLSRSPILATSQHYSRSTSQFNQNTSANYNLTLAHPQTEKLHCDHS